MGGSPSSAPYAPPATKPLGATLIRFQPQLLLPRRRQLLPVPTDRHLEHKPFSSSSPFASFRKQQHVPFRATGTRGESRRSGGEGRRALLPPSAVTYGASISTDIPLYEPPWAPIDEYLADRPRVFRAMFPDNRRSQRINDEEWRIRMLPLQFLLVSVNPVVVMRLRCRSSSHGNGNGPPSGAPRGVSRVLELQATRWELQGLERDYIPPHFDLVVQGSLYSDRRGGRSRLKGHLEMSISLVLPSVFALLPGEMLRSVAESLLKGLVERMKKEVDVNLLEDYRKFSKERAHRQQLPSTSRTGSN